MKPGLRRRRPTPGQLGYLPMLNHMTHRLMIALPTLALLASAASGQQLRYIAQDNGLQAGDADILTGFTDAHQVVGGKYFPPQYAHQNGFVYAAGTYSL